VKQLLWSAETLFILSGFIPGVFNEVQLEFPHPYSPHRSADQWLDRKQAAAMKNVHIVGTVVADIIARSKSLPKPGETVIGQGLGLRLGGKGLNQAVHVRESFTHRGIAATVSFSSCVGDDVFGRKALALLSRCKIESFVGVSLQQATGTGTIHMEENGQNAIIVSPGANAEIVLGKGALERIRGCDAVVCQLEVDPILAVNAFKTCRGRRILNAAPVPPSLSSLVLESLSLSDVVIVNEVEAADLGLLDKNGKLTGEFTKLCNRAEGLIVTRGAHGAVVYGRHGQSISIPGTKDVSTDAVGAGDCFVGHFVATLLSSHQTLASSAHEANNAAGHYVSICKQELSLKQVFG
jgi:ribokinase